MPLSSISSSSPSMPSQPLKMRLSFPPKPSGEEEEGRKQKSMENRAKNKQK